MSFTKLSAIYIIRNKVNGKIYVGSSTRVKKKIAKHRNQLRADQHGNSHLQASWNKYGEDAFEFVIYETCSPELLITRETFWVEEFGTLDEKKGYNYFLPNNLKVHRPRNPLYQTSTNQYVCLNVESKQKLILTIYEIKIQLKINSDKVHRCCAYWRGKKGKKKLNGWIFVNTKDFKEEFDYIDHTIPKTKPPYAPKTRKRKSPSEIIPYAQRNIQRTSIILESVENGSQLIFPSIAEAIQSLELVPTKVQKCLKAEFKRYKHRGYYIRRASF